MKTAEEMGKWHGLDCHPEFEDCVKALEEYAKQYEDLLWDIINEKDKAKNTEDLFAVLQKIEIARDKIPVKPF